MIGNLDHRAQADTGVPVYNPGGQAFTVEARHGMPNLRQLEYLVAIAETRNFRRAAEQSHTTQPTLSEQLKSLETRLGAQLVERTRSRVILTPIGNQVVAIARRMLADAEEIRSLSASGGRELAGVLRLGLPPTIGPYLLPLLIPELQRHYPDLKLYVREELPSGLVGALVEGRHDLVMTPLPTNNREIVTEVLFREPLYVCVAKNHVLASEPKLRRKHLEGEDILALGRGHQLHDVVLALCEECGARLRYDYEGTSLDTLREMVAMGLGLTFLPGLYVHHVAARDESIRIVELHDRAVYRIIGLAWRKSSARHEQYGDLTELLRTLVKGRFSEFAA
ncbi:MAG: LysR substrate-binding domain-containing protein [Pseudomonadota bacterium]